jgi:DNA repair exonuclease SbcCD ATPase subunit
MGYRIGKVKYHNFGPFADAEIDLDRPGVTLIEGAIEGMPGCDSNGAGKSFIFDGVAWALYGRCIRPEYSGDDVVKLKSKGGCSVEVTITKGKEELIVRRYRNDPEYKSQLHVLIDGNNVTRGVNAETQAIVERTLGMDYLTFCNTVAFGVREDVKSFFTASDGDRKKVLDTLLGLEIYSAAETVARRRLKSAVTALEEKRLLIQTSGIRIDEKREAIRRMEEAEVVDTASTLADHKAKLKEAEANVETWVKKVADLENEVERVRDKQDDENTRLNEESVAYKNKIDALELRRVKADNDRLLARMAVGGAERALADAKSLSGKPCPTCQQSVPAFNVSSVRDKLQAALAMAKSAYATVDAEYQKVCVAQDAVSYPQPSDEHQKLTEELAVLESRVDKRRETLNKWKNARNVATSMIEQLENAKKRSGDRIKAAQAELQKLLDETHDVKDAIEGDEQRAAELEFWVQAFGNQGLKSFLIEAEVPEVNKHATRYARRLLGEGAKVQLKATTTLKTSGATREKLTVEGVIPGKTNKYTGASQGQKKRMDLSLLLAFRKLISQRVQQPFDQLFADEIFDGLDQSGVEVIGELLREESAAGPVVLITHDSRMKPLGDQYVHVFHDGVTATVQASGGVPSVAKSDGQAVKVRKVRAARA